MPSARRTVRDYSDALTCFKINIFIPLLATIPKQLEARFGDRQQTSLRLCCRLPIWLRPWSDIKKAVEQYSSILEGHQKGEFETWTDSHVDRQTAQRSPNNGAVCPRSLPTGVSAKHDKAAADPRRAARDHGRAKALFSRVSLVATGIRATMSEERLKLMHAPNQPSPSPDG